MKTDERIIKYIEDELTPSERKTFEVELKKSDELKSELRKYLKVYEGTAFLKNLKLDHKYLDTILPEFRDRIDSNKQFSIKRNLSLVFGLMLIFIFSVVILKTFFSKQTDIEEFTASLSEEEKIEVLNNINGEQKTYELLAENIKESELVFLFETDLRVNSEIAEVYEIDYSDIVQDLSEEEIENIYQKIINTKLLEEVSL